MFICKFLLLVNAWLFSNMFQLNKLFSIKCNKIMACEPVMIYEAVKACIWRYHPNINLYSRPTKSGLSGNMLSTT
jgi:hypothetical protein